MVQQEEETKESEVAEISKETAEKGPEEQKEEEGVQLTFLMGDGMVLPEAEKDKIWGNEAEEEEKKEMFYNIDQEMVEMYLKAQKMLVPFDEKKLF